MLDYEVRYERAQFYRWLALGVSAALSVIAIAISLVALYDENVMALSLFLLAIIPSFVCGLLVGRAIVRKWEMD